MNKRIIAGLYKKEIIDILRDKKTILMMIVVPLVLYPLLFIGSMALTQSILTQDTKNTFRINVQAEEGLEELKDFIVTTGNKHDYDFLFIQDIMLEADDGIPKSAIEDGIIDACIIKNDSGDKTEFKVVYDSSDNMSSTAATMLKTVIDDYKEKMREDKVAQLGVSPDDVLNSVSFKESDIASTEKSIGSLFGYIIPFLLVSSVLMGAMYPAIDTTAGEKERGTLETLLTMPVKNIELIISKFLATSTIAAGTAFLNVASMGILGAYFFETIKSTTEEEISFSVAAYIPSIAITMVLAVIFAMFSSAVCLLVCIYAKSFKEAQNYSTPVMLVFMVAGMAGMVPAITLNNTTALIPIVNTALLIGQLFTFEFDIKLILLVIISNVLYTMIVVVLMARLFNSEAVLFGDATDSIRLIENRSNMKDKQIPGIGDVALLLSVLLIILLLVGSLLVIKFGFWGVIIQQSIILFGTLIYSWYIKTDYRKVFSLKSPSVVDLIASVISWAGLFILITFISAITSRIFPESTQSLSEEYDILMGNQPTLLILFGMALLPAIGEELLFRGFLYGTLSNRLKPWLAIVITGLVFGAYHMSLAKLIAVSMLGAYFAYVIYKRGSICNTMLMHFLNNAVGLLITIYEDSLKNKLPFLFDDNLGIVQIIILLLLGTALFIAGLIIINRKNKNNYNN